jgi:hypothetical protein
MEAFPHMSTIDYFVENEADKYPQSHVLDFHNKADGHERRIATYLVENLRTATDLEVCNAAALVIIRDFMTDSNADTHLPYTGRSSGDHDVRIPGMASPVG